MKKIFYLIFVSALIVSCGESGSSEKELDVITNAEKIYTFKRLSIRRNLNVITMTTKEGFGNSSNAKIVL